MDNFFKYRNLYTFAAIVFGAVLIYNLGRLGIKIKGQGYLPTYIVVMGAAWIATLIGYTTLRPKALGIGSVLWLFSIGFNLAAIFFVVPIAILNIVGRNKLLNILEIEDEKKEKEND